MAFSFVLLAAVLIGRAPGDLVLAGASKRILSHRTGDLKVRVVDGSGKPVRGAEVSVRQIRHDFLFGCNIFAFGTFRDPELEQAYRKRFAELLNYATLPFYWASFEPQKGRPQYARVEAMAEWCARHGITCKGHPLVWNHPAGVPSWLPDDPRKVRSLLLERVKACVRHFRGKIDIWDVVNEAAQPFRFNTRPQITKLIRAEGVQRYLRDAFEAAREANPGATLLINDYRVGEDYVRVIRSLSEGGKRLYDVIGIQSHMHGGVWPLKRIWEVCERFAAFGVPIHFTETTIVSGRRIRGRRRWGPTEPESEKKQAEEAVRFYTVLFSHPAVTAVTWWDFSDARAWQGAPAGFLRKDCSPKPVYEKLRALIRGKWWTEARATTDREGRAEMRAFFGKYNILVTLPDGRSLPRTVDFPRPWPPPLSKRAVKEVTVTVSD